MSRTVFFIQLIVIGLTISLGNGFMLRYMPVSTLKDINQNIFEKFPEAMISNFEDIKKGSALGNSVAFGSDKGILDQRRPNYVMMILPQRKRFMDFRV